MAEEGKKVSFGFAKSIKKSALKILPKVEEKKIDYIECLDDKVIKVVGGEEEKKDGPLVIPLLGSKTWHDRILNKTDADIFEPKIKNESSIKVTNGDVKSEEVPSMDVSRIKKEEPEETVPKSLEEQAASEIMEDLRGNNIKVENSDFTVPLANNEALQGKQESTLEDYEQIPIDAFGLAMLRGMGWKPGKGIGRNEQLVVASLPELRPRGMGLGADKAMIQKQIFQADAKGEELKLEKNSFVQIIAGKYTNNYGQIEAFDDEDGRITIKMALTGENLSLNECLVKPVSKAEYMKNSKVLNVSKYEEYNNEKSTNESEKTQIVTLDSETSENGDSKNRYEGRKISKKSKKRSKYTSDESSDSDRRSRKRRNSSDSDQRDNRHKKTKKSKKSHKRESSAERSSKKSKKKDKKKTRERKNDHTESSDRGKHKKHKRSRSRSTARR